MFRLSTIASLVVLMISSSTVISNSARGQDNVAIFMKAKLSHSQQVLKGLALEDFDLIAKNAQAMSLLCEDVNWMVLQTPEYRERSSEFRRSVDTITEAAKKKNLEGAALGYVDATMKCVNCHKYVRKVRMAKLEEFPGLKLNANTR